MPALLMPVILLGGIYSGVMTPTEAAAVAAAYAFLVAVLWYRNITVRDTYQAVLNSSRATASIGMLIAGALVFNYVVTIEQIPQTVKGLLAGYDLSPTMFLFWVNVILLVLGCLLEGSTIILVILPIFIPTAKALGIDLVHFGVVAVFNIMIGLITPPYGLLLFIISAISGAPLRTHHPRHHAVRHRDDRRARDHHLRSGDRALAAAPDGLQGLSARPAFEPPAGGPHGLAAKSLQARPGGRPPADRTLVQPARRLRGGGGRGIGIRLAAVRYRALAGRSR